MSQEKFWPTIIVSMVITTIVLFIGLYQANQAPKKKLLGFNETGGVLLAALMGGGMIGSIIGLLIFVISQSTRWISFRARFTMYQFTIDPMPQDKTRAIGDPTTRYMVKMVYVTASIVDWSNATVMGKILPSRKHTIWRKNFRKRTTRIFRIKFGELPGVFKYSSGVGTVEAYGTEVEWGTILWISRRLNERSCLLFLVLPIAWADDFDHVCRFDSFWWILFAAVFPEPGYETKVMPQTIEPMQPTPSRDWLRKKFQNLTLLLVEYTVCLLN